MLSMLRCCLFPDCRAAALKMLWFYLLSQRGNNSESLFFGCRFFATRCFASVFSCSCAEPFKDCFEGESFALYLNNGLQILSKPFLFFLIKYLTLGCALSLQALYLTNASSKEVPSHLLIYHYITNYSNVPP